MSTQTEDLSNFWFEHGVNPAGLARWESGWEVLKDSVMATLLNVVQTLTLSYKFISFEQQR